MLSFLSYSIGGILGAQLFFTRLFWLVCDIVQKKHSVLCNYPLIGRLRFLLEKQGELIRQYLIAGEWDEMPFNRAARNDVMRTDEILFCNRFRAVMMQ